MIICFLQLIELIFRRWALYFVASFLFLTACTKANHLLIEIPSAFLGVKEGSYCAKKEFDYIVFMSFPYGSQEERALIEDMLGRSASEGDVDVKINGVHRVNMRMRDIIREGFSSGAVYSTSEVVHLKEGCHQVEVRVNEAISISSRLEIGVYPKSDY